MWKTERQNDDGDDDNAESQGPVRFEIILGFTWCCGQFVSQNRQNICDTHLLDMWKAKVKFFWHNWRTKTGRKFWTILILHVALQYNQF